MNCPTCTTERLVIAERSGIEIDYCPRCRGVWLDRGELDKLIERAAVAAMPAPAAPFATPTGAPMPAPQPARRHWSDDDDWKYAKHGKKRKRGSFLGEIFDF